MLSLNGGFPCFGLCIFTLRVFLSWTTSSEFLMQFNVCFVYMYIYRERENERSHPLVIYRFVPISDNLRTV